MVQMIFRISKLGDFKVNQLLIFRAVFFDPNEFYQNTLDSNFFFNPGGIRGHFWGVEDV